MKSFKQFISEKASAKHGIDGLTIFDIDDTLFHTFAMISVMKDGKVVKRLTNREFNIYKLKDGESYDFGEFRDAKKFNESSKVIVKMMNRAKAILKGIESMPNSKMIIITARADFDNKDLFLNTFKEHGFDIDKVYVERAGNLGSGSSAERKVEIITKYIDNGSYGSVRLFDDAMANLTAFQGMKDKYPDINFYAYEALHDGSIKGLQ